MRKSDDIIKYGALTERIFRGEEIIFASEFDMSSAGSFTDGFFVMSLSRFCVIENGEIREVGNISDIDKAVCARYPQSGMVEIFRHGTRREAVRFSMKYVEEFMNAAEIINDIKEKNEVKKENNTSQKILCEKCGRPFLRGTGICPHCTDKTGMLKKLWQLSKPCRKLYALLLIFFWITSATSILSPLFSKWLIDGVLTAENAQMKSLLGISFLMLLCITVSSAVNALRSGVSAKASNLLVAELRNHIYEKLQKLPLGYIEDKKTGDLMQRINNDTQRIQVFIQDIAIMAVNEAFLFISLAAVTFYLDLKMALLIFIPMPFSLWIIGKIRTNIQRRYRKQWRKMDTLTNRLTEVINGIKIVKAFGREDDEIKSFCENAAIVRDLTVRNEKFVYTIFPLIKFIMSFGSYFVFLYGGSKVIGGDMRLGELVQFSSYAGYLYSKLEWFGMLPRHFTMALVSAQRVFEVLDESEEENAGGEKPKEESGEFSFENVSFGYKKYRKVLKNISQTVKKGEMIGLVGHSGAGKSTMINLIMRLYSPDSGKLLLDEKDLQSYEEKAYKDILGVVLQENYLFGGTVLENIRYAKATASIEECIIAAKRANAHDFIMKLPDAYDTYVGEKGYKLSGGERQRIAIARAILSNPSILILDEATASVDTETEIKIREALSDVTEGKTVFAIAHRLSTLKNADRLFVIDDGKIAETGTHKELLEKNGIYAELFRAQTKMAQISATIDNTNVQNEEKDERRI